MFTITPNHHIAWEACERPLRLNENTDLTNKYANGTPKLLKQVIVVTAPVNHPPRRVPEYKKKKKQRTDLEAGSGASHHTHSEKKKYESYVVTSILSCWRPFCSPAHTQGHVPGAHWGIQLEIHLDTHTHAHSPVVHTHTRTGNRWHALAIVKMRRLNEIHEFVGVLLMI